MSIVVAIQDARDQELEDGGAEPPDGDDVQAWVAAAVGERIREAELTVRIVGEAEGRALNERFRGKASATNVLSFPFEPPPGVPVPPELGDLVLCAPVVAREAREQGKPLREHWAHLVVHGVLHLLGYDHEDDAEAERMEGEERRILGQLGVPDPYAPRPATSGEGHDVG